MLEDGWEIGLLNTETLAVEMHDTDDMIHEYSHDSDRDSESTCATCVTAA